MATKKKSRKGKGHYAVYKAQRRKEKSHYRRIKKHLERFPDDQTAQDALKNYKVLSGA